MADLRISPTVSIPDAELTESFVRASGPGGQNVQKVSSAVELRFDVARTGAIAPPAKLRLARLAGRRLTKDGVLVIQADRFRTQERNRADARERLAALVAAALVPPRVRKRTRPSRASKEERLASKRRRSQAKRRRARPGED